MIHGILILSTFNIPIPHSKVLILLISHPESASYFNIWQRRKTEGTETVNDPLISLDLQYDQESQEPKSQGW